MDSLVRYIITPFKRFLTTLAKEDNALFTNATDEQVTRGDTVINQASRQQNTTEDRIQWIDKMIQLVPSLLDQQRQSSVGAYLRYFYFHYLEEKQIVIFRISSCNCGACDNDLNTKRIHGEFSEQSWEEFWPIAIGRLRYLHKYSTNDRFNRCICIMSQPNEPSMLIESEIYPFVIMWDHKPASAHMLSCSSLPRSSEDELPSTQYERAPDSSALH